MSIYKIILGICTLLLFLYYLVAIARFVVANNVSIASDGIRVEVESKYPETNNLYMEGVTVQEYTAEIKE
jgi:hypothetical protein